MGSPGVDMREGEVELQKAVQGTAVVVVVRAVFGIPEIAWSKGPRQGVQLLGRSTGISRSELSAFHCVYAKPQYRYGKSGVFPVKSVNWICEHITTEGPTAGVPTESFSPGANRSFCRSP